MHCKQNFDMPKLWYLWWKLVHFEKKIVSINSYSVRRGHIRYDFFTRLLSRKQQTQHSRMILMNKIVSIWAWKWKNICLEDWTSISLKLSILHTLDCLIQMYMGKKLNFFFFFFFLQCGLLQVKAAIPPTPTIADKLASYPNTSIMFVLHSTTDFISTVRLIDL